MEFDLDQIKKILKQHDLLIEMQNNLIEDKITGVNYDSKFVKPGNLFFCKGKNFKLDYLNEAIQKGATVYVSENSYSEAANITGIIVKSIAKAMALISALYYGNPEEELFIVGITGTKGKTSTAYFTYSILEEQKPNTTALFSTINRIVGPKPEHKFKSDLTTPESLDLFKEMRTAVNNGLTNLVMEVSSQAYLLNRVYNIKFDIGVFLNIFPDHIGENEHENFEDYLKCKQQLLLNSKLLIVNSDMEHFDQIYTVAKSNHNIDEIILFSREDPKVLEAVQDFSYISLDNDVGQNKIRLMTHNLRSHLLGMDGEYTINLMGDYNQVNAVASVIVGGIKKVKHLQAVNALKKTIIPGRMECIDSLNHGKIFVDYAHNFISLNELLKFLRCGMQDGKLIVVIGSTGNKGVSRRSGFGKALSNNADVVFLTSDDPGYEDPNDIADQIKNSITNKNLIVNKIIDRKKAILEAIKLSGSKDIVVLAGKGEDPYQKIKGVDEPWPTDMVVAKEILKNLE